MDWPNYPEPQTDNAREAAGIVAAYQQDIKAVRSDDRVTDSAKREDVEALYRRASERLADLQEADRVLFAERTQDLERQVFGLAGKGGFASGPDAISARDAADRAARITDREDAAELMLRARRNGDAVLEKAVAARAFERGFDEVVADYAAQHPGHDDALREISGIQQLTTDLGYASHFYLAAPPEARATFVGIR